MDGQRRGLVQYLLIITSCEEADDGRDKNAAQPKLSSSLVTFYGVISSKIVGDDTCGGPNV